MTFSDHVLAALPQAPGAELPEVLAVVRRAVPGATEAEVVSALGALATGPRGRRLDDCSTRRDERGAWITRWWRV